MMTIREALQILEDSGINFYRPYYCILKHDGKTKYLCWDKDGYYYWGPFSKANSFRDPNDVKIGLKYATGGTAGEVIIAKREGDELVDAHSGDRVVDLSKEV